MIGTITGNEEAIDVYFKNNYTQLHKYAAKIITDKKRTYEAVDIVGELYGYLRAKQDLRTETLDQFCKKWISRTIGMPRSFANLKMSFKTDLSEDSAVTIPDEVRTERGGEEVNRIISKMEERQATAIRALLKWNDVEKAARSICMQKKDYAKLLRRIIKEHF